MRCPYCDRKLSWWSWVLEALEARFARDTSKTPIIRSSSRIP